MKFYLMAGLAYDYVLKAIGIWIWIQECNTEQNWTFLAKLHKCIEKFGRHHFAVLTKESTFKLY